MRRAAQTPGLPFAAWLLAMLLALAAHCAARAAVAVPELNRRVTDLTGTLTPDTVSRLEKTLAQFEATKGSQIAVLMLPSTKPEDIAQYGIRVAEAWKVGRKGVDDGAILIVAKDDRRVRIEVGYGLEGVLSDAVTRRIIAEDITPRFKQGDFSGGVMAGVTRMMQLIAGEPLPPPQGSADNRTQDNPLIVFIFIGGVIGGMILSAFLGKGLGWSVAAVGSGVLVWLLSGIFLLGIVIAFFVFFMLVSILASASGHGGGRWGSGSWRGGGGGGGGFSGGGGGFGGGGSSGSW